MKLRLLLMLALVMGAALLARGAAAQPYVNGGLVGYPIHDVAVDRASNRVYVTADHIGQGVNGVVVLDGASNRLVATVHVSSGAGTLSSVGAVDVNSTTGRVYVTVPGSWPLRHDAGSVSVIDGKTNMVVATVPVGLSPLDVAVNPSTNLIYVANVDSNDVSVIDGSSNTVVATIPVGQWPMGVAVNPTTNLIYVAGGAAWSGTVSVIDGGSNTVVATIPAGYAPDRVAVNRNTNSIYVATDPYGPSGDVSVIDGTTNTVVATFPAMDARDVAVNPATNHVFLARQSPVAGVLVIDGATNSVVRTLDVSDAIDPAVAVAVNPVTGLVYVASGIWWATFRVEVFDDSPGAANLPAASPTPVPAPTPTACPLPPAPPPGDGMEWVPLQCGTCNPNATTYPDSTPIGTIAASVAPPGELESLWGFEGGVWRGWSAEFPEASDLTQVDRLDVVFICVGGSATFTRPVI